MPVRIPSWGLALAAWLAPALAMAQGIYTCVDAQGRRHTADRPIMECLDREQKELMPRGGVRRVIPPSLTADERVAKEARERAEAERQARDSEAQRRERALVQRYPNETAHNRDRAEALAQVEAVIATIRQRQAALEQDREKLRGELEFYQRDPSKAPAALKHRQQENAQQIAAQQTALQNQEREKQRINARFDEELERLRQIWAGPQTAER